MLDRLPAECVALIVRHVPLRTLLDCTSTCHTCLAVAALDDVWWDLFRRVAPDRMPSAVGDGGYRAAFRPYVLSDSPIIVQLEPTRTLVGFATEGAQRMRVLLYSAYCEQPPKHSRDSRCPHTCPPRTPRPLRRPCFMIGFDILVHQRPSGAIRKEASNPRTSQ